MTGGFHGYYDISSLYPSVNRLFMLNERLSTPEELQQIEETLFVLIWAISSKRIVFKNEDPFTFTRRLRDAYRNFNIFYNSYMNLINKSELEQIAILLNENRELKKKLAEYEGGDNEDKIYDL